MRPILCVVLAFCVMPAVGGTPPQGRTLAQCVNEFQPGRVDSTAVGYQYWFVGKEYLDGRTIKLSVVHPHQATHAPHAHLEDEFFFVLEGRAELILDDERRIVGPFTSFYCPAERLHGIRNVGDTELKYLVIKKYPLQGQAER